MNQVQNGLSIFTKCFNIKVSICPIGTIFTKQQPVESIYHCRFTGSIFTTNKSFFIGEVYSEIPNFLEIL